MFKRWLNIITLVAMLLGTFAFAAPTPAAPFTEAGGTTTGESKYQFEAVETTPINPPLPPTLSEINAAPVIMQPQTDGEVSTRVPAKRWIVQLQDPPLAQYTGGIATLSATAASATGAARLNVNTPDAKAYIAHLEAQQVGVATAVQQAVPGAYVEHDYQVVFNGLTVNLPEADENAGAWLSQLPGVKQVFREQAHQLDMYASLPLINASTLWTQVGGQAEAGKDVKIASIDTGIYPFNDCFDPTGYTYPAGYPLFDTDKPYTTTEKVIVARAYFRADDPPTTGDEATYPGTNGSSHGTHTSGSMACIPGIVAETAGYTETISGVAPAAYLMSYRVFYPSDGPFSGSAFDPELIAAIEDAVIDGADVVNNSWGGGSSSAYPTALDLAYDAAWDAGMVVVFSAGNSGPYPSTTDHPSDKNILVGASTTDGTIVAGKLSVSAPEPITDTLQDLAFTTAMFGEELPAGNVYTYPFVSAQVISPTNFEGCDPWPAGTFTGNAALISRGACDFSTKVFNAQEGGADFVIVHNHATGGDTLINMAPGTNAISVTIPSVFIMHTPGLGMVAWYTTYTDTSEIEFDTIGYQAGNIPDRLASFSSRGPSIRQMMTPDLVAPGVNIFSSGYGAGSEATSYAGFGQVSGTSMSAPHVTGSAAVLKQLHPNWTPAQIKSALMNTANINVADYDGSEAGVLDYGAGRIDLGHAGDPGLTFDNPSVSFGKIYAGESDAMAVMATDVFSRAAATVTYTLAISETGDVTTTGYFTLSVAPSSLTFDDDGDTSSFDVTMDIAAGAPAGDYEGFVWLRDGSHELHIPVWARVWPTMGDKVLLIDDELSPYTGADYTGYYTRTLEALGVDYDYYDTLGDWAFPDLTTLQQYKAVIWYTGDNYYSDIPAEGDEDILIAYLQGGGRLLATGQDLAGTANYGDETNLYNGFLGADYVQDDVFSGTVSFPHAVNGLSWASDLNLDVGYTATMPIWMDGAGNQGWVDEVAVYTEPGGVSIPAQPFLQAVNPITGGLQADGYVGLTRASEPTLEKTAQIFDGRTVYLSFGFEGVNDPYTGTLELVTSRDDLMAELLTYLWTEPTVSLPSTVVATTDVTTTFVADVGSVLTSTYHTADIAQYRWDFGDGSAFEITTIPTATHVYQSAGTFTTRVEVTDDYGHTALAKSTTTVTGYIYLPLVMRGS